MNDELRNLDDERGDPAPTGPFAAEIEAWVARAPAPPPELEERIAAELQREGRRGRIVWRLTAAAALLVMASGLWFVGGAGSSQDGPRGLVLGEALVRAELAQEDAEIRVARLELAAAPLLARITDPELTPRQAGPLLAARARLDSLDDEINQTRAFLARNPGHAHARRALTRTMRAKAALLHDLIGRGERS